VTVTQSPEIFITDDNSTLKEVLLMWKYRIMLTLLQKALWRQRMDIDQVQALQRTTCPQQEEKRYERLDTNPQLHTMDKVDRLAKEPGR
jgi:hypothetical protein